MGGGMGVKAASAPVLSISKVKPLCRDARGFFYCSVKKMLYDKMQQHLFFQ